MTPIFSKVWASTGLRSEDVGLNHLVVCRVVNRHSETLDVVAVGGEHYLTEFFGSVGVVFYYFFHS